MDAKGRRVETSHERLRAARKAAGFGSASEAATALGIPPGTYLGHENGSRSFDVESAKRYGRKFKVTLTWLLSGEGPMKFSPEDRHKASFANLEGQLLRTADEMMNDDSERLDHGEGIFAAGIPYKSRLPGGRPEIDVRVGAGEGNIGDIIIVDTPGGAISGHRVLDEWVFPNSFFRHELRASASHVIIQPIVGDSMSPTLQPGDRVIVDTAQNRFGPEGIYVIDDGDSEPRVKRLSKVLFSSPQRIQIVSDNPLHAVQTVELSMVRIIGRVVGKVSRL